MTCCKKSPAERCFNCKGIFCQNHIFRKGLCRPCYLKYYNFLSERVKERRSVNNKLCCILNAKSKCAHCKMTFCKDHAFMDDEGKHHECPSFRRWRNFDRPLKITRCCIKAPFSICRCGAPWCEKCHDADDKAGISFRRSHLRLKCWLCGEESNYRKSWEHPNSYS